MFKVRKLRIMLGVSIITLLVLLSGYYVLSGRTFLADIVAQRVKETLEKAGFMSITWDNVSGNPITGVSFHGVRIIDGENEITSMGEFSLRFSLGTVASPNPQVSRVIIKKMFLDANKISTLPAKPDFSSNVAWTGDVTLLDSTINTSLGVLLLGNAKFSADRSGFSVSVKGKFLDEDVSLYGDGEMNDGTALIKSMELEFGRSRFLAAGYVLPSVSLNCLAQNVETSLLYSVFPQLKNDYMEGTYSASAVLSIPDLGAPFSFETSGTLDSSGGKLWEFPFSRMSSKFYCGSGSLRIRDASLDIWNGNISGAADVDFSQKGWPLITARLEGKSIETAQMESAFYWIKSFPGIIEAASCDLSGPLNSISARGTAHASSFEAAGFPCTDVTANVSIKNGRAIAVDFLGNMQGSPLKGKGLVSFANEAHVSCDITLPKLAAESFYDNFSFLRDWKIAGTGNVKLGITGPVSDLVFSPSIAFEKVKLMDSFEMSSVAAEMIYSGDDFLIKSSQGKLGGTSIKMDGKIKFSDLSPAKLDIMGKASGLDISQFEKFAPALKEYKLSGSGNVSWSLKGDTKNPIANIDIDIPALLANKKALIKNAVCSLSYAHPKIEISKLLFNVNGSPFNGAGSVTAPTQNNPLDFNIKGSFKEINPSLFASYGVPGDVSGKLSGDIRVWKTGDEPASVRVFFKDALLNYGKKAQLSGINGTITFAGGNLSFDKLKTSMNAGNISLSGTVHNAISYAEPSSVPLDLTATITSADIDRLARLANPLSKGFQGSASGTVLVKGNLASPRISAEGVLTAVRAFGFFLPLVEIKDVKADKKHIEFPNVRALVGRGFINATGGIDIKNDFTSYINAAGTSVDIRALAGPMNSEIRRDISGALDFNFKGQGPIKSFKGKGQGRIPALTVFGLKASNAVADFSINDGYAIVEDSSANAYGGKIKAQIVQDFNNTAWGGTFEVKSADIAPAIRDFMPNEKGSVTGTANFKVRFTGDSKRTSMTDGNGVLDIYDGIISGFEGAEKISEMLGGKPLRYAVGHLTFSLDGKTVNIIPGTRITAPKDDKIYKYVMFDGNATTDLDLNLNCNGNVNLRALNALVAGLQGVLSTAVEKGGDFGNSGELFKNFLGDVITGYTRDEFRGVRMKIKGKPENLSFSDIKIDSAVKVDTLPDALKTKKNDNIKEGAGLKLTVEIPVGPGGDDKSSGSVGGQLGGQILDQLLKGLIFEDD